MCPLEQNEQYQAERSTQSNIFNDGYKVSEQFAKASYGPSIIFLITASVLPFIGRLIFESMTNSNSEISGLRGISEHADSLNKATKVLATFDIIAAVVGIIGVILLIKTFRANMKGTISRPV